MAATITFWDVEHGHASYLRTPNGRHVVVDLGVGSYERSDEAFSPLKHLKDSLGVRQLDYVVITHPHRDHIDDILNLDSLSPKVLCRPRHLTRDDVMKDVRPQDRNLFEKYFALDSRYSAEIVGANALQPSANWGGVEMHYFLSRACAVSNINNHSIVLVVKYAQSTVVLTGDNESCSLKDLMTREDFCAAVQNADILLAPHHGREAGYDPDFVGLVNPALTIISDGRFCDTSCTASYSSQSRGWPVQLRSGHREQRRCLTTRSDGVITVSFGQGGAGPFLSIAAS